MAIISGRSSGGVGGWGSNKPAAVLPGLAAALLLLVALPLLIWAIDSTSTVHVYIIPSFVVSQQAVSTRIGAAPPSRLPPPLPQQQQQQQTNDSRRPASLGVSHSNSHPTGRNASISTEASVAASWVTAELMDQHYTSTLLSRWLTPGGSPCRDSRTTNVSIPALDTASDHPIRLSTGAIHEFLVTALDEPGRPRCLGGDYFETDLSGDAWKSRPPINDHGNGSYTVSLQVHQDFSGQYNFTIVLLFRSFEGLKFSPQKFSLKLQLRSFRIEFYSDTNSSSSQLLPALKLCGSPSDFSRRGWSGRWTRHARNDSCPISHDGRYRCQPPDHPCQPPWCTGALGSLESNGWVYSAHCSFRLYRQDSAWRCLNGKWLFFWGDSNHVDTIRNLLHFVLGRADILSVPRRFDALYSNPSNASESVRITSIFNGHWNETMNYQGLNSLTNADFRTLLWTYFNEEDSTPDAMILNSGLHDGVHFPSVRQFAQAADYAAGFWDGVFKHWERSKKRLPALFYRTTIATGGYARELAFNPSKMEAFNGVVVEKLQQKGLFQSGGGVIDQFDMTFPWHFDNRCSDGVHYGRAPAKAKWRDGEIGHQYFVDLMLGHVLLNAICSNAR